MKLTRKKYGLIRWRSVCFRIPLMFIGVRNELNIVWWKWQLWIKFPTGPFQKLKNGGIHFFDRVSIYSHPALSEVNTEYWRGHRRKKVVSIGKLTFWTRDSR